MGVELSNALSHAWLCTRTLGTGYTLSMPSANCEQLSIEGATGKRDEVEKERGNDVDMREREEAEEG